MSEEMVKGISNKDLLQLAMIGLVAKMNDSRDEIAYGKKHSQAFLVEHHTKKLDHMWEQHAALAQAMNQEARA